MKKGILFLTALTLIISQPIMAEEQQPPQFNPPPPRHGEMLPKPDKKQIKEMNKKIAERLNLTDEQVKTLKADRQKNMKELEKIIRKMEEKHKKIRDIYLLGLPKYQADLKSAPYKMELVMLKQEADKIRNQNRKNFEAILTEEQKEEFKKMRSELPKRPHGRPPRPEKAEN